MSHVKHFVRSPAGTISSFTHQMLLLFEAISFAHCCQPAASIPSQRPQQRIGPAGVPPKGQQDFDDWGNVCLAAYGLAGGMVSPHTLPIYWAIFFHSSQRLAGVCLFRSAGHTGRLVQQTQSVQMGVVCRAKPLGWAAPFRQFFHLHLLTHFHPPF